MPVEIREVSTAVLAVYACIPIAFEVRTILDAAVRAGGLGGIVLTERVLDAPYVKDYDALDDGPEGWPRRFDVGRWGFFAAYEGEQIVGGAAVALGSDDVDMLERRKDLAVLWDLRVAPEARGRGAGAALFSAAAAWAATQGCRQLKVETQNVNVPACRFYARQGCTLGGLHRFAYSDLPDEVQLLWYRPLP